MATNDNIQHGIDDNPNNDAEKGAALGGLGGVAVGAAAGSLAGPLGTVVGAVAGGLLGAGASGAAVAAVDAVDNDNTISGVGSGATPATTGVYDRDMAPNVHASSGAPVTGTDVGGHNIVTGDSATTEAGNTGLAGGAVAGGLIGAAVGGPVGAVVGGTLGSLAGGVAGDATEAADDTASVNQGASTFNATTAPDVHAGVSTPATHVSGAMNQNNAGQGYAADNNFAGDAFRASAGIGSNPDTNLAPTRDMYSGTTSIGGVDQNADTAVVGGLGTNSTPGVRSDTNLPGVQTGGVTTAGSDTRGLSEKAADALTGDRMDDKTGGVVLNEPTTNAADSVRGAAHSAGNAMRNAGSGVAGAVHGVIGDVTHAGNDVPGVQTGGTTSAGSDTRGITEKAADAVTGDRVDDKTGGVVR